MIKCAKCGYDNPAGQLHCKQCQARLKLEQITPGSFSPSHHRLEIGRQILLALILIVVTSLALVLWPEQVEPIHASSSELGKAHNKMLVLQKGVAVGPVDFSEKEVNILFNYLLRENRPQAGNINQVMEINYSHVTIKPDELIVELNYNCGPFELGGFSLGQYTITYRIGGTAERQAEGLRFNATSVSIGHLPVPLVGRNLGMKRLQNLFSPYKNARVFLSKLEINEMKKGAIAVSVAH